MINLTDNAVKQLKQFRKEADIENYGFRVRVQAGGCSGVSYQLDFDKEPTKEDNILNIQDLPVYIDPKTAKYVEQLTIDYVNTLNEQGFKFQNEASKSVCGCGRSFSCG